MDKLNERLRKLLQSGEASEVTPEMLGELSDDQRDEFLELQEALQRLEQARPKEQSDVDSAPYGADPTPDAGTRIREIEDFTPNWIGNYRVLETVARGGFGIVLKARDPKLDRIVALKIPRLEAWIGSEEARERFAREARLVAMLGHPAIVPVYESGSDGPFLFIASAFCNGGTLGQWFQDRDRSVHPLQAASMASRLAAAVQHAHAHGVIHRDLKPGNVLLHFDHGVSRETDAAIPDALRITDFGLARSTFSTQELTQTGATIGTPAYMSPEQCRGDARQIGVASDIYALGAILYELLAGRPPHVGQSNLATMRAVEKDAPESLRRINSAVPQDLEAICLKCLEKEPQHRYQSAQQLEDDLQRFLAGQPVVARPLTPMYRLFRWSRHNPLVAGSLAAAFTALLLGLAFSIAFAVQANRSRKLADTKSREALNQARLARKAVDDLQRAIAQEPMLQSKGLQSFRQQVLTSANEYYQLLAEERPDDRQVLQEYIEVLTGLARLHSELGERSRAVSILRQAFDLHESEFPDDRITQTDMQLTMAADLSRLRRHHEAVEMAAAAVQELETLAAKQQSEDAQRRWINGLCVLSEQQQTRGSLTAAVELADQAISMARQLPGVERGKWPADRLFARLLLLKSSVSMALMQHANVEKYAPLAIDVLHRLDVHDAEHEISNLQSTATLHSHLSSSHSLRRNFEEANKHLAKERETLDKLIQLQPETASNHAHSANQLLRYAKSLYESGDIPATRQVLTTYLPQIATTLQEFPEENVLQTTMVLCYQLRARTFRRANDMQSATSELAKAIALGRALCNAEQSSSQQCMILATLYMEQSTFFLQQKMYEAAASECERGLVILEDLYDQEPEGEHVGQLEMAYNLCGNAMNKANRFGDYLALSDAITTWPRNTPNIRKARAHRIVSLASVGAWAGAESEFGKLVSGTSNPGEFLNLTGLASRCAAIAGNGHGKDSQEYGYFLEQCQAMFERVIDLGLAEDESVTRLFEQHPDFTELHNTESYSRWIR